MKSFKAYQAAGTPPQHYDCYSRAKPLMCNAVAFDDFGTFDTTQFCYVAPYAQRMEFHVNLLWNAPQDGYAFAAHLMLNQLGTTGGAPGGEFAGYDRTVNEKYTNMHESMQVTQIIDLAAGDKVWAVATVTLGGAGCNLTGSVAGNGHITTNYFTGKELKVL